MTIEEEWKWYYSQMFPKGVPEKYEREIKSAFVCGASMMHKAWRDSAELEKEQATVRLKEMERQLHVEALSLMNQARPNPNN